MADAGGVVMKMLRFAMVLGLTLLACSGGEGTLETSAPLTAQGKVSAPSGLEVTATISAVTLGDDCGGSGAALAPSESGGRCADDSPCGSPCQRSNLQLAFTAGPGGQKARVEITEVTLHDAGGTKIDTLSASGAQAWNGNGYAAWDQTVAPSADLKASYTLSAPSWSTIEKSGTSSYSQKYLVRVVLRIDGQSLTLESSTLSREPPVAT